MRVGRACAARLPTAANSRIAGQTQDGKVDRSLAVLVRGPRGNVVDDLNVAADPEDRRAASARPDGAAEAFGPVVFDHAAGEDHRGGGSVGADAAADVRGVAGDLAALHGKRAAAVHVNAAAAVADRAVDVRVAADRAAAERELAAVDRDAAAVVLSDAAAGDVSARNAGGSVRAAGALGIAVNDRQLGAASDSNDAVPRRARFYSEAVQVKRTIAGGNVDGTSDRRVLIKGQRGAVCPVCKRVGEIGIFGQRGAVRYRSRRRDPDLRFTVGGRQDRVVSVVGGEVFHRAAAGKAARKHADLRHGKADARILIKSARHIDLRLRGIIRPQRDVVDVGFSLRVVVTDDRAARHVEAGIDACIDVDSAVVVFGVIVFDDTAGHIENGHRRGVVIMQGDRGAAGPVCLVIRDHAVQHGKRAVVDIHARGAVLRIVVADGAAVHSDPAAVFDVDTAASVPV